MKFFIPGLMLLGMFASGEAKYASQMKINVAQMQSLGNGALGYQLDCEGAHGAVDYQVEGLPLGARLQGDQLIIGANTKAGDYYVKIIGTDELTGLRAEKILNLSVSRLQEVGSTGNIGLGDAPNTNDVNRLNAILGQFSDVSNIPLPTYQGNRFPTTNFPTGGNPDGLNLEPQRIASTQATRTVSNRNTITEADVTLKAGSERYQNAVKGITNLLKIIDQARANKLQAQNDLNAYTQAYNNALGKQREAQNQIINAQIKLQQIQSALANAQGKLGDINAKIDDLNKLADDLTNQKGDILDDLAENEQKRNDLMEKLKDINAELGDKVDDLRDQKQDCDNTKNTLMNNQDDLAQKRQELATISQRRADVEADLAAKQKLVDDLRAQLDAAEADLADAKIELANVIDDQAKLPAQINKLQQLINEYQSKAQICSAQIIETQKEIDDLQNNEVVGLTGDIDDITDDILDLRKRSGEIDRDLANNQENIAKYQAKLGDTQDAANFLRGQINGANDVLRRAYADGNDANTEVNFAKENLVAVNDRYERQCQIQNQATLNLERARAEEALSKLALDEIVAHYTDALPYSIVPNGNGVNPGTPYGNNPSGSALGEATQGTDAFEVQDWTNYLSNAFGKGINPRIDGNINRLYPFRMESQGATSGLRGGCGGSGPIRSVTGQVVSIGSSHIDLNTDYGQVRVEINPCTRLTSNQAGYNFQVGDQFIGTLLEQGNQRSCQQGIAIRQ